jgi:NAD(P)-dependent dehydrogenase (short-subunit alcohol dehydrogenase family)
VSSVVSLRSAYWSQAMGLSTRDKLFLGVAAGAGAAWGARQWLRARRRITLDGRVVVLTGASTGHGLLAARHAAEHGARLVIAARDPEELDAAKVDLNRAGARDVLAVPTDVTDRRQCEQLIERALERHGHVDILVNNAGIIQVGPLESMTLHDFETALATNFWGALYCTLAVLPSMRARHFGRIGNVVSVGGKMPVPHLLPYTASKFALTGLTKGLRIELAKDNILVTGIYPGTMRTGGHTHAWIKGNTQAEYAMFALSDSLPLVSKSAESVARALWRGLCDGDAEVHAGWQARVATVCDGLLPNASAEMLALVARLLPRSSGLGETAVQGQDVHGALPDLLSRLVPPSTRPSHAG